MARFLDVFYVTFEFCHTSTDLAFNTSCLPLLDWTTGQKQANSLALCISELNECATYAASVEKKPDKDAESL